MRPDVVNDPDQRKLVEQVSRVQMNPAEQVLDAPVVAGARAPDDAVHVVALREQELREIGTVLPGDAADESPFRHDRWLSV